MSIDQEERTAGRRTVRSVAASMRPEIISCPRHATVPQIAATMVRHRVHAVLVPPLEPGLPLIVTDLDVVRAAVHRSGDPRAADLAREPVPMLPSDAPFAKAIEMMAVRYVTHLLATDPSSGEPTGVVSSLDVAAVAGGVDPAWLHGPPPEQLRPEARALRLAEARVSDVMHPGIVTCAPSASLSIVARTMADHRVHCVAVAGIDPTPGVHRLTWGLITDMEILVAAHGGTLGTQAASLASAPPLAVPDSEPLASAARVMADRSSRHLVVVGADELPSGIVSTLDVAEAIAASKH